MQAEDHTKYCGVIHNGALSDFLQFDPDLCLDQITTHFQSILFMVENT